MAINFPATAGQATDGSFKYTAAGIVYYWDGSSWVAEGGNVTPQIDLTALSVTTNAVGTAGLSYNNTTGVFSYTPPDLSGYLTSYTVTASDLNGISIDALSDVDTATTAPTTGQVLKWDGSNWVPDTDGGGGGGIALTDLSVSTASAGSSALSYNNGTGVFTYTPPDLSSYLTSLGDASGVTTAKINNWDTSYGWGDHSTAGYLTSYTRNPAIYEIIGLESWTSIHNAPILFTQALDDPTGAGNQPTWLQSYYNEVSGDSNNATATLTTVATGGHAALNQQTADGVTLQTAIRNFVNSTGSLPGNPNSATYLITPTGTAGDNQGPETYTVDGVSYPVMGSLYVPDYSVVGSRDVIVAFHGTLADDTANPANQNGIEEQASFFLTNILTNANTLSLVDKIIFSVAYPQDHISNVRQYNLSGVGKEEPTFLMGDNLPYARAAVKWAINSLDAFIAAQGGSATIGNVYLLGHSQGGKLAAKINTLETGIAGVVSNSPGPIQFDQTCSADPTNDTCSKVAAIHGPASVSSSGSYSDSDVDSHLNKSSAATGQVLGWNGTDYNWVNASQTSQTTGSVFAFTTHSGNGSNYVISGTDRLTTHANADDPTITVKVGDQITFDNAGLGGGHPMYIRIGSGAASVTTPTAIGEGTDSVSWTPAAAGTFYYQCGITSHAGMIGTIVVQNADTEYDTLDLVTSRNPQTNNKITLGDINNGGELDISLENNNHLQIFGGSNEAYFRNTQSNGGAGGGTINIQGRQGVSLWKDTNQLGLTIDNNCAVTLFYQTQTKLKTTSSGVDITGDLNVSGSISDAMGPLRKLGSNSQTGTYTLIADDAGKYVVNTGASTNYTVDPNIFSSGDMVSIVNNSTNDLDITQGTGITLYFAADGSSGARVLSARGVCTILFVSGTVGYISGSGLS